MMFFLGKIVNHVEGERPINYTCNNLYPGVPYYH